MSGLFFARLPALAVQAGWALGVRGSAMNLNDGDATFVGSFNKIGWTEDGRKMTFGFRPPRGEQFVVMLLGSAKKDATDFDLEGALNRLGFYRKEEA